MDELYRLTLMVVVIAALVAMVIIVAVFCTAIYLREVKFKGSATVDVHNQKIDTDIDVSSNDSKQDKINK